MNHVYYNKSFKNTWINLVNVPCKQWKGNTVYDWQGLRDWVELPFSYKGEKDIMLLKYHSGFNNSNHKVVLNYAGCTCISYVSNLARRVPIATLFNLIPIQRYDLLKYFDGGFMEARKYKSKSHDISSLHCDNCGNKKEMRISDLSSKGFSCPKCSMNISYPERFTMTLLEMLGFKYETQKRFPPYKWRYDFYIKELDMVIEVHGQQHFHNAWQTKEETARNDNDKRKTIIFILGLKYVPIDFSKSNPLYGWSMFEQSPLGKYMVSIKFKELVEKLQNRHVNENYLDVIRDYKDGISMTKIGVKYNTHRMNIRYMLIKAGVYEKPKYKGEHNFRQIICITTGEEFRSIKHASDVTGIHVSGISQNCLGQSKSAGKTPDGRKRVWMYLEDYEKQLK